MTHDEMFEMPPAVLDRCPPSLALPTADPHALAVEAMLRFVGAHFVKHDAPLPVACEIRTAVNNKNTSWRSKGQKERHEGCMACLNFIENNTHLDAEMVPSDQQPLLLCVKVLALKSLFPAFVYITHMDDGLYKSVIQKAIVPKVATTWQRLRGTYRNDVLEHNPSCGHYSSVEEAVKEIESGLRALETLHVAHANSAGTFLLGTERPCSADAMAYAAASSFLHADFAGHQASTVILEAQQRLREECPVLLKYVEKLRMLYFEEYSAFYNLRPTESCNQGMKNGMESSQDDMYRRGRWTTITCTVGFTLMYFVLTNAKLILLLLEELSEEEEEEEDMEENERGEHGENEGRIKSKEESK
ncbi:uncharacterized protein TM35_000481380 [Trypanosoma theileri]|uniref:Metaxin glutathione S-transferase domain-containing protein n=1 Tax=Trypanosoma theileri TaxID=67003 RepID=A0A1X0NHP3_9TRYP|nr:uncharacterized protein TM35_000481380 [Trypanosoma theileri]ORC84177.1 hypothetical protein TM35_000481380 [Trypanosoma theileri]